MALTTAQKTAIFAALDEARERTIDADEQTQQRAMMQALAAAAGDLSVSEVARALREHAHEMEIQERGIQRVRRAMDAVMREVQRAGVANPGELMGLRGVRTVPELLASLGFTGDLDALANEMERAVQRAA